MKIRDGKQVLLQVQNLCEPLDSYSPQSAACVSHGDIDYLLRPKGLVISASITHQRTVSGIALVMVCQV